MVDDTATLDLPWGVLRRLGGGEAAPALGRIGAVPLQQAGWSVLLRADLEDVDGLAYLVISVEGQSPPLRYTFDRRMRDWFSEDEGTEPTPESIGSCMVVPSDGRLASVLLGHTRSLKVALKPFSEDDLRAEGWGKIKRRPVTSLFSGRVSPLRVPLLRAHQEQDPPPMLDLAALPRLVQVPDPVGARPLQPGRGGRWDFAHPRPIPSYFTRQVHSSLTQTVCADNEMSDSVFSRSKLSVALEPLPGRGVMVDVVLSAAGQDFPAHRAVLAAASDVFLAMFTPQSKSKARVTVAGVSSPAVFQKFLDFFYTGALWNLSNMAADLLSLAERFQVEALKKHCQEQLFQDPPPTPVEAGAYIPNPDVIEPDRGGFINLLVEVPWSETPYRHRPSLLLPSNESISCEVAGDGNSLTASFQGKSVNLLVEVSREVRNCWSRQAPPPGRARNERFKFLSPEDCRHDATFLQRHTRSLAVRARLAAPIVTRPLVSLGLQRLRDRGALCDVVLSAAGEDFVAHRVVLAAGSEVFLTMFTGYFLENNESRVTIEDVASAAAFEKFLEFFYTGSVRDMEGYQLDLLQLADRYIMPALQDLCQSRVIASLDSSNAVAIFKTSVETTFVPEDVRQKAVQIMFQSWNAVIASEDWADFKRTHHDVARTLETASDVYRLRF